MRTKGAIRLTSPMAAWGEGASLMARCAASKPNREPCERIAALEEADVEGERFSWGA
jgi:hypothetical protein